MMRKSGVLAADRGEAERSTGQSALPGRQRVGDTE